MPGTPEWMAPSENRDGPVDLRTDRPHAARIYDALLGGRTNYPADRAMALKVAANIPTAQAAVRVNRSFMRRATRHLAAEAGIRQFLDIGTGIPTPPNLHEVAQLVAPECRVVYVDNDPLVLSHSRALHSSDPAGSTAYIDADASDPEGILASPQLRETLDLGEPVAVSMCLLLHWLLPSEDPYAVVRRLLRDLVPGSALVITHLASDVDAAGVGGVESALASSGAPLRARNRDEVAAFFDGLALVEPGLVLPQHWRPECAATDTADPEGEIPDDAVPIWAGVALTKA